MSGIQSAFGQRPPG